MDVFGVALLDHETLLTDNAADESDSSVREVLTHISFVVFTGLGVQEMDTAEGGLPCSQGHDGAHGADVGGHDIGPGTLPDEQVRSLVDQRVVGTGDGKAVLQFHLVPLQSNVDGGTGFQAFTVLVNDEEAAGLGEAGDDARAARHRDCDILTVHFRDAAAEEFFILERRGQLAGDLRLDLLVPLRFAMSEQRADVLDDLLHDDDAGDRVTGHAAEGLLADHAEDGGFAGLDGDAVDQQFAEVREDGGRVVVPAGGGTRNGQDRVTLFRRFGDRRFEQVDLVFDDRVHDRVGAPVREHGGEDGGVELRDVAGFQVGVAVDDLIAGRDDAEDRALDDFHFIDTGSHEGADESGRHDGVGRNDHIAHADILTDLADVVPGDAGGVQEDVPVLCLDDVLDHDDRVGVLGQRVAGVDDDVVRFGQADRVAFGGAHGLRREDGDAVHGARDIVGRGTDRVMGAGGHTVVGFPDFDHFGGDRNVGRADRVDDLLPGFVQRDIGQELILFQNSNTFTLAPRSRPSRSLGMVMVPSARDRTETTPDFAGSGTALPSSSATPRISSRP